MILAAAAAVAAAGCRFEALVPLEVRCACKSELVVVGGGCCNDIVKQELKCTWWSSS